MKLIYAIAFIKVNFPFVCLVSAAIQNLLNCIYWSNVEVIEFAYFCIQVLSEKYCILYIPFISSVTGSNKCSAFNFISLLFFFSKHFKKRLYKQNFIRKCNAIYRIKYNLDNKNSQSLKFELSFS